jgi:hypothetical protein
MVNRGLSMYVVDKESFVYVTKSNANAIPLVQQMNHSNGISAYIDKSKLPAKFKNKVEKAGKISINPDQPLCYYQTTEFIGNSVIIIDTSKLTRNQSLYIVTEIQRIRKGSTWNDKFPKEQVKIAKIQLPIKNDKIDFEFMESFIAELEAERLSELEAYLVVSGLKDYTLTDQEEKVLKDFEEEEFKEFNVIDIFEVKNTKNILSRDIVENSGKTPYLCASSENNAISSYISYDEKFLDKGNCVFIGGKTFVVTYQENDFYSNDSHNLALYSKSIENNKLNQLFLATCINKSLGYKYSWGDSISNRKIQADKVSLPIKNKKPDYKTMEIFISAIKKQVIKDLVLYVDRKKEETKNMKKANA